MIVNRGDAIEIECAGRTYRCTVIAANNEGDRRADAWCITGKSIPPESGGIYWMQKQDGGTVCKLQQGG